MSAEEAAAKEIELITFYDSYYHGLNNTLGGEGRLKYSTIEEKKMAIAAAQKKYHDKIKGSDQSKRYLDYNNRLHKNKYYNPATRDHELEIQAKARNKRRSTAEGKQYEQDKNKKSKEAVKQLRQSLIALYSVIPSAFSESDIAYIFEKNKHGYIHMSKKQLQLIYDTAISN